MKLGDKLARLRKIAKLSQEELADKLGVARQTVSKWELEDTPPRVDSLLVVCQYFDISVSDLIDPDIDVFDKEYLEKRKKFQEELNIRMEAEQRKLGLEPDDGDISSRDDEGAAKVCECASDGVEGQDDTVALAETESDETNAYMREFRARLARERSIKKIILILCAMLSFVISVALFAWVRYEEDMFAQSHEYFKGTADVFVYIHWGDILYTVSLVCAMTFVIVVTVLIISYIIEKRKIKKCLSKFEK